MGTYGVRPGVTLFFKCLSGTRVFTRFGILHTVDFNITSLTFFNIFHVCDLKMTFKRS